MAATYVETRWDRIVDLYDLLFELYPSPIVALNRAIAMAENGQSELALRSLKELVHSKSLAAYPFLPAALGELFRRRGYRQEACVNFNTAVSLARNGQERAAFEKQLKRTDLV